MLGTIDNIEILFYIYIKSGYYTIMGKTPSYSYVYLDEGMWDQDYSSP